MKIGLRKSSIKKRIKARTTGKIKRKIKRSINPLYGKKGMGWINDPKRALYNKIYNKTTFSIDSVINSCTSIPNSNNGSRPISYDKNSSNILKAILIIAFLPFVLIYYFLKLVIKNFIK